jgi:hypothetical protein
MREYAYIERHDGHERHDPTLVGLSGPHPPAAGPPVAPPGAVCLRVGGRAAHASIQGVTPPAKDAGIRAGRGEAPGAMDALSDRTATPAGWKAPGAAGRSGREPGPSSRGQKRRCASPEETRPAAVGGVRCGEEHMLICWPQYMRRGAYVTLGSSRSLTSLKGELPHVRRDR